MHPSNKNELLAWDLASDPAELADLNAEQIRLRLFTKTADLPAGTSRLPIKSVHINKSPVVTRQLKVLSAEMAQRWGIDLAVQLQRAAIARDLPDMSAIWAQVYAKTDGIPTDVDEDLYSGFVSNADRKRLDDLLRRSPADLARVHPTFDDARLHELLWRYRARNFADSLSADERLRWDAHRAARLFDGAGGAVTLAAWTEQLDQMAVQLTDQQAEGDAQGDRNMAILEALYDYAEMIVPARE